MSKITSKGITATSYFNYVDETSDDSVRNIAARVYQRLVDPSYVNTIDGSDAGYGKYLSILEAVSNPITPNGNNMVILTDEIYNIFDAFVSNVKDIFGIQLTLFHEISDGYVSLVGTVALVDTMCVFNDYYENGKLPRSTDDISRTVGTEDKKNSIAEKYKLTKEANFRVASDFTFSPNDIVDLVDDTVSASTICEMLYIGRRPGQSRFTVMSGELDEPLFALTISPSDDAYKLKVEEHNLDDVRRSTEYQQFTDNANSVLCALDNCAAKIKSKTSTDLDPSVTPQVLEAKVAAEKSSTPRAGSRSASVARAVNTVVEIASRGRSPVKQSAPAVSHPTSGSLTGHAASSSSIAKQQMQSKNSRAKL